MKKIFVLPAVLMMAASCRTVTFNDLHSPNSNVSKLPALDVKVDKDSLKTAYPVRKISSGSGAESGSLNFYGSVSSYEQDSRARDIVLNSPLILPVEAAILSRLLIMTFVTISLPRPVKSAANLRLA